MSTCLSLVHKCGCGRRKKKKQKHPLSLPQTRLQHKQKPLVTVPMKIIDLQAWVRWRVYHVTQAQLWNEEKREIMVSRLVEQHRAFTPHPLPSFCRACVVSLPLVFLSFSTVSAFVLNHILNQSFNKESLSTSYARFLFVLSPLSIVPIHAWVHFFHMFL